MFYLNKRFWRFVQGGVPHQAHAARHLCEMVSGRQVHPERLRRDEHPHLEGQCLGETGSGESFYYRELNEGRTPLPYFRCLTPSSFCCFRKKISISLAFSVRWWDRKSLILWWFGPLVWQRTWIQVVNSLLKLFYVVQLDLINEVCVFLGRGSNASLLNPARINSRCCCQAFRIMCNKKQHHSQ